MQIRNRIYQAKIDAHTHTTHTLSTALKRKELTSVFFSVYLRIINHLQRNSEPLARMLLSETKDKTHTGNNKMKRKRRRKKPEREEKNYAQR